MILFIICWVKYIFCPYKILYFTFNPYIIFFPSLIPCFFYLFTKLVSAINLVLLTADMTDESLH